MRRIAALAGSLLLAAGCASMFPNEVKQAAAELSYEAQQAKCVTDHKSDPIEKERACRAEVRRRWCVDEKTKNPGHCPDAGPLAPDPDVSDASDIPKGDL